jgi:quinoprotein glucose dehydrogenase
MTQINRETVKRLEVAWTYHTGENNPNRGKPIECTPIVIDGVMYITTAYTDVVALDAASGKPVWKYEAFSSSKPALGPLASGGVNRGVAYWSDGKVDGKRRIFLGASDGRLISVNAVTGKPDPAFGRGGIVNLRSYVDRNIEGLSYGATSPPVICGNVVVLSHSVGEGPGSVAPGDILAHDVLTGKQLWRFHTVPRPGEFGNDTWEEDSWKDRGGANAWGGCSVDVERGWIFAATGSATFDFYGGDRKGDNLFANCVLALEAKTGKRIWHFQTLRHDLWDHDLPVYPNLITVNHNNQKVDAVAQVTKTGYVFLLDRDTGKPLFDIIERPAPASTVPGEAASPTQPVPVKPPAFSRLTIGERDLTDISPEAHAFALNWYRKLIAGAEFTPPSLQDSLIVPGLHGGATWSGASYDPETGVLYVNSNENAWIGGLTEAGPDRPFRYLFKGYIRFADQEGYPAIKPPWGMLNAIDMNAGDFAWRTVFGEFPELTQRGLPPTGTESFGGSIVTAGGLVFIGGTQDEKFHAYDKRTGELLWDYQLPAGGYATPCTYMVAGRQYVSIAAGGGGKVATGISDAFYTFALP